MFLTRVYSLVIGSHKYSIDCVVYIYIVYIRREQLSILYWLLFSATCQFQLQFNKILRSTAHPYRSIGTYSYCWIYSNVCAPLLGVTGYHLRTSLAIVALRGETLRRFPTHRKGSLLGNETDHFPTPLFFIDFRVFAFRAYCQLHFNSWLSGTVTKGMTMME